MNEKVAFNIFIVILSLLCIIVPELLWALKYGFIKDAEPTDFSIKCTRIFGAIILGIFIISVIFS